MPYAEPAYFLPAAEAGATDRRVEERGEAVIVLRVREKNV